MRSLFSLCIYSTIASLLFQMTGASCYYPDGSFPKDYTYQACPGDDDTATTCCRPSEAEQCLSNGLCYDPTLQWLTRGACTDDDWGGNCFQYCHNETSSLGQSYDRLISCGGDRYCCYSDSTTCCNDDSKVFSVPAGTMVTQLGTHTYTPYKATATSVGAGTATGTAKITNPAITSAGIYPTFTGSSSTSSTKSGPSLTLIATVASVGGAVLLAIAVFILRWCQRRRRQARMFPPLAPMPMAQGPPAPFAGPVPVENDGLQPVPGKNPFQVMTSSTPATPSPTLIHAPPPPVQTFDTDPIYEPHQSPPPRAGAHEMDLTQAPMPPNPQSPPRAGALEMDPAQMPTRRPVKSPPPGTYEMDPTSPFSPNNMSPRPPQGVHEMNNYGPPQGAGAHEMDAMRVHEMGSPNVQYGHELPGHMVHEAPTEPYGRR